MEDWATRLSSVIQTWLAFNVSTKSDKELAALRRTLVSFLFSHRQTGAMAGTWTNEFAEACISSALARERTLAEEIEAFREMSEAFRVGGKLEAMTVAELGCHR